MSGQPKEPTKTETKERKKKNKIGGEQGVEPSKKRADEGCVTSKDSIARDIMRMRKRHWRIRPASRYSQRSSYPQARRPWNCRYKRPAMPCKSTCSQDTQNLHEGEGKRGGDSFLDRLCGIPLLRMEPGSRQDHGLHSKSHQTVPEPVPASDESIPAPDHKVLGCAQRGGDGRDRRLQLIYPLRHG